MDNSPQPPKKENQPPESEEDKEKLARPPKDKREVTIGPTTETGPDITLG